MNQAFGINTSIAYNPQLKNKHEVRLYQRHAIRVPKIYVYDNHGKLIKFSPEDPLSLIVAKAHGVYKYRPQKK